MGDRNIARRYAAAFMDLLQGEGQAAAGVADLNDALAALQGEGGAAFQALSAPLFTLDERRRVLDAVLERLSLQPLSANLLRLVLDKGRMVLFPDIVEECLAIADERAGRVRVAVDAAEPLTPQLEIEVRVALEQLTGRSVILDTKVVPELLGGIIARVGGKVYDASLRTRLSEIKHQLIHARVVPEA
ncbi:MAG: ATP synthase F1 subunit delta [Deltaproteobacteria bacterium]|nr:ATP synthase F1 subunit delta [Deltaproteobacteria bacterium]